MDTIPAGWLTWLESATGRAGECWIWPRAINGSGYGVVRIGSRVYGVHCAAWMANAGEQVPDGLEIDHKCNVPACCNPDHLQAVPHAENTRLAMVRRAALRPPKTVIPSGSIRVRPAAKGDAKFAVLFRDMGKQRSRTFDTEQDAQEFLATLPGRKSHKRAS